MSNSLSSISDNGRPLHSARAIAARAAAASLLLDPVGTPTHGATELQPAVPLVRRAFGRRSGLGAHGVQQEPRPATGGRHRGGLHVGCAKPAASAGLVSDEHFSVDGTLIKAWATLAQGSAKRSLVEGQRRGVLPPQGRHGRASGAGAQRRAQLPGREEVERDTCLDHRSGRAAGPEIRRPGGEAGLHRAPADGNRNGLVVDARPTHATGTAEPEAALEMLGELPGSGQKTVGPTRTTTRRRSSPRRGRSM
jgi:hypothetical protein